MRVMAQSRTICKSSITLQTKSDSTDGSGVKPNFQVVKDEGAKWLDDIEGNDFIYMIYHRNISY